MSRHGETEIGMVWRLFDDTGRRIEGTYDFNLTVMRTGMTGDDQPPSAGRQQEYDCGSIRYGNPDDIEQWYIQRQKVYDY